eukprot:symbB.v1.2.020082.t1/scaffold1588.1/size110444/2
MWRLLKSPPSVMREPMILASALRASSPWSAQHAEATALRHRLEVLARNLETGEGEAVDHAWVQRFVAAHTRLMELGCRLEAGFLDLDAEVQRLQRVLAHPRVLGALKGKAEELPQPESGQVFHYGDEDAGQGEDLESTYEAFERFAEEDALCHPLPLLHPIAALFHWYKQERLQGWDRIRRPFAQVVTVFATNDEHHNQVASGPCSFGHSAESDRNSVRLSGLCMGPTRRC